jgi:hypothetical protein
VNPYFALPFWQEFGIILAGTILLFIVSIKLEKKIRGKNKGEPHGDHRTTPSR